MVDTNDKITQVATLEDCQTTINIDYEGLTMEIYTNRATVMRRMERAGHEPYKVDKLDGKVYGMFYRFPSSMIGKFLRTGIFKHD